MARVNHKRVKQLLNEKRSRITDRQFFTSRILAGHFEDMAMAQTRRYKYNRRIHVAISWSPKSGEVACTNNLSVLINAGHRLVTQNRGRENRYEIVCGLFAHELGHCLYTDFLAGQTYNNYLSREKWYPEPPAYKLPKDTVSERALWEYVRLEPRNNEMLRYVAHHISNVIEDAYIENRILAQFRGTLGNCLEALREQQYESIPTVTELIEKEDDGNCHIFESILQIMLSYVKFGEIKHGDAPLSDERIQVIFKLIHDLDAAIVNPSGKERLNVVNLILVRCWDYIEDFLEICKKRQEEAKASGSTESLAETIAQLLQAMAGSSVSGEGSSTPIPEVGAVCVAAGAGKRAQTAAQAEKASLKEAAALKGPSPRLTPNPSVLVPGSPRPKIRRKKVQLPEIWKALPAGSRQYPRKKTDASPISRQIVFPKAAEGLPSTMMHMSVNAMTMQRRTLSACWTRWRKRPPASSWRMNGHGNSTMWPRASPMEMFMPVLISV